MNRFKRNISLGAICAALLASQMVVTPLSAVASPVPVKIGTHVVFTNSVGVTQTIQDNLDNALVGAKDRSPSAVHVVTAKTGSVITLSGYKIVTVDAAKAKAAGTTGPVLAKRWAEALRKELANTTTVNAYVAQLSGGGDTQVATEPAIAPARVPSQTTVAVQASVPVAQQPTSVAPVQQAGVQVNTNGQQPPLQGRVMYAPAGLALPVVLRTAISTQIAKPGDLVQGEISEDINLGNGRIPAGSTIIGQVSDSSAGRRLDRSASLSINFNRLRLPDGTEVPISAHIVGGLGKYATNGSEGGDTVRGETGKNKIESAAIRTALGAGSGAALGTAVGAIAGGGHGAGKGAWSGAAIGSGLGLADSVLLRKSADVVISSGTHIQLQLDAPLSISASPSSNY